MILTWPELWEFSPTVKNIYRRFFRVGFLERWSTNLLNSQFSTKSRGHKNNLSWVTYPSYQHWTNWTKRKVRLNLINGSILKIKTKFNNKAKDNGTTVANHINTRYWQTIFPLAVAWDTDHILCAMEFKHSLFSTLLIQLHLRKKSKMILQKLTVTLLRRLNHATSRGNQKYM